MAGWSRTALVPPTMSHWRPPATIWSASHAGAATMLLAQPQSTLRPQNDDIKSDHAAPAASCASSALSMKAGSV